MKSIMGKAIGMAAGLYATAASAQASFSTGSSNDIKFQWGVPEQAASSGSGNVYFQLEAPSSYSWVGLGIGSGMSGAEIFLMYQDGNGNVTLSPRAGKGHVMPEFSARKNLGLLEGSGVSGGKMVANVRCSDCDSLDLGGKNSWIAAWKEGESLDSTNKDQQIDFHDDKNVFNVDFSQASISSDANPFLSTSNNGKNGNSGKSDGDSAVSEGGGESNMDTILLAHGVIMTLVFTVLYPIGSMLMPLLGKWLIHGVFQFVAFLLMWAGFGLGYDLADSSGIFFKQTHTRIGTIVVALLGIQPVLGYLHHLHFSKHGQRGIISHLHIWYGRILMVLGIVNGGMGLKLAGSSNSFVIAYSVIAAVIGAAYVGTAVFGQVKRGRSGAPSKGSPSMTQNN